MIDHCGSLGAYRHIGELTLVPGTSVYLVGSCGWACGPCSEGLASWAHTSDTGHPTVYRPDPNAVTGRADALPVRAG